MGCTCLWRHLVLAMDPIIILVHHSQGLDWQQQLSPKKRNLLNCLNRSLYFWGHIGPLSIDILWHINFTFGLHSQQWEINLTLLGIQIFFFFFNLKGQSVQVIWWSTQWAFTWQGQSVQVVMEYTQGLRMNWHNAVWSHEKIRIKLKRMNAHA